MDLHEYLSQDGAPSSAAFARKLELNPDQVRQWRTRHHGRQPSPENCVAIEKATDGVVTRQDLRPDDWRAIWPELVATKHKKASA